MIKVLRHLPTKPGTTVRKSQNELRNDMCNTVILYSKLWQLLNIMYFRINLVKALISTFLLPTLLPMHFMVSRVQ